MSLKFKTLVSVVLGVGALVVGAQSALAQSSIDDRKKALGRDFALGDPAVNNTWQAGPSGANVYGDASDRAAVASGGNVFADAHQRGTVPSTTPQWLKALQARSEALNRQYRLGEYAPTSSVSTESPSQRAERLRGEALNRQYRLGEYSTPMVDSHERVDLGNPPASVPTVSSGSEIDWPELGIGFGVGMVLVLGLILTVRVGRSRPLAH